MQRSLHPKAAYNLVYKDLHDVMHDVSVDALWYAQRLHSSLHNREQLKTMEEHDAIVVSDTNQLHASPEAEVRHCMKLYGVCETLRLKMETYWKTTPEFRAGIEL